MGYAAAIILSARNARAGYLTLSLSRRRYHCLDLFRRWDLAIPSTQLFSRRAKTGVRIARVRLLSCSLRQGKT